MNMGKCLKSQASMDYMRNKLGRTSTRSRCLVLAEMHELCVSFIFFAE